MILNMKKQRSKPNSDTLNAVALQDHLKRSLQLDLNLANPLKSSQKLEKKMAYRKPVVKAVINTNRNARSQDKTKHLNEEKEYVLDAKPPAPTLAQKMGLIEQPKQLLNETEWSSLKAQAKSRDEFGQPCVICKEDLGKQAHVILSCSHVFHKNCLQAFERFSGKKTCPMCRREQYQTRVVFDGKASYQHKCATRIQALWRGYVVRCWYKKVRESVPPKDPKLRQKFYEDKLKSITERMVQSLDLNLNSFLYDVDRNLEQSRRVFQQFEAAQRVISSEQWFNIYQKASCRHDNECPICLTVTTDDRKLVLTSCSHIYHQTCLSMFEELNQANNKTCPVCRSSYQSFSIPENMLPETISGDSADFP